jgi:hypothetical protein
MLSKKLVKSFLVWSIPFVSLVIILFFINIIKKDYLYGHNLLYTARGPYNWLYDYTVIPLKKFYIHAVNDNKEYLPKIKLYLSEKKLNYFLTNIPDSAKTWQKGKIIHDLDRKNLRDVSIRLRGDNPENWFMEKQSFRVKLRKKEMHGRYRYYNFQPFEIRVLVSNRLAKSAKIYSQRVRPVELLINEEKKGLYLEVEHLNENFLRRNKVMPVNLYKGENMNQEMKIALPYYLFSNSGLWSKQANFNFYPEENKEDLKLFLRILNDSRNNSSSFKIFKSYLDEEYIGRYLAYLVLSQNFHTGRHHNNRLIFDPWKGQIFPVVTDPSFDFNTNTNLDYSNNDLISFLNQSPYFIDLKFQYLKKLLFEENIIDKEINYLINSKQSINNVIRKDPILTNIIPEIFIKNENFKMIESAISVLKDRKKILKAELKRNPNVYWKKEENNFSLILNDQLPISKIELTFDEKIPKWVFLDENYNNIYDKNEIKFFKNNNKIILNTGLYANRLNSNDLYNLINNNIKITPTKFNFISSNGSSPLKIKISNIFLKKDVPVKYAPKKIIIATKTKNLNEIIFEDVSKKNDQQIISGKIFVDEDLIFEKPIKILKGTTFFIDEGVNIIFKNKVEAIGDKNNKIKFVSKSNKPWGTIAIIGKKTNGSELSFLEIRDGSGSYSKQFHYTAMLSIHNSKNIKLSNINFDQNHKFDDMLHVIYSSNVYLENLIFNNAHGDAIDIDMCRNIFIKNSKFYNSNNDGIDLMESNVIIKNVKIFDSKDKAISIGEYSNAKITSSELKNNNIAVAVKDGSEVDIDKIDFLENSVQVSAYKKNLQYGDGGKVYITNSNFVNEENNFSSKDSSITIKNSKLSGQINFIGENINVYN